MVRKVTLFVIDKIKQWLDQMGRTVCGLDDIVEFALGLYGITVAETVIILAQCWWDEENGEHGAKCH